MRVPRLFDEAVLQLVCHSVEAQPRRIPACEFKSLSFLCNKALKISQSGVASPEEEEENLEKTLQGISEFK